MRMVSLSLYCSRHCNLTYNSNDTSNGGSCKNVFILCHLSLGPIKLIRDLLYNERLDDGVGITSPYVWQKFLWALVVTPKLSDTSNIRDLFVQLFESEAPYGVSPGGGQLCVAVSCRVGIVILIKLLCFFVGMLASCSPWVFCIYG